MRRNSQAAGCPELQRDPPSVARTLVDHVEDFRVEPDVGVVVAPTRQLVGSDIHLLGSMDCDEEDLRMCAR